MTPEVREGLRKWFREYAAWLSSDPMALRDYGKEQNHGLSYHVQLIAYARYCGDEAAARKNLEMMLRKSFRSCFQVKGALKGLFVLALAFWTRLS